MSSSDENKAMIRRLVEEVYGGDLDRLDDFIVGDYVDHSRWGDRAGLRRVLTALRHAYPDVRFTVDDVIAEDDKVAARVHCECRCADSSLPDKKIDATVVFRIKEGKVVEHWGHSDSFF